MNEENYWTRILRSRTTRRDVFRAGLLAGGSISALSWLGCSTETPRASTGSTPVVSQPKKGGVFKLSTTGDPPHLDPHLEMSYRIQGTVAFAMNRLLRYKNGPDVKPGDSIPAPDLAEKWEQTDDTTYVFNLRKGVKWHNIAPVNGRELTADDVKWSYDRFTVQAPFRTFWKELSSLTVVDKYTLRFKLNNPYAPFLAYVASPFSYIMAKEVVDTYGDGKKNVIGTGPWMLDKYEPTVRFVFKRNPDYFEKDLPYLDGVEFLIVPDASTALAALRSGDLDQGNVTDADLASFKASKPEAQYRDYVGTSTIYYWDVTEPPFNDPRVRQAASMAIDRDAWIKARFGGKGEWHFVIAADQDYWKIPKDQLGEGLKYYKFDKEGAKKLLAEAGYPNGLDVDFTTTAGYGTSHVQNTELMAGFLKDVGIRVNIKMQEYAAFLATTFKGQYKGMASVPSRGWLDPDEILGSMFSIGGSLNLSHVDDAKLNDMLIKQQRTLNREERKKVLWDIERYLATQMYYMYQPVGYTHEVLQPWVRDYWKVNGYGKEAYYTTWFDK